MLTFSENPDKKYDAVFFHESFHHCRDPIALIKNLSDIVTDEGIICFASEPVMSFPLKIFPNPVLPYPWGIRLDGISVWSMRRFGWLELGFESTFFMKMLSDAGFSSEYRYSDVSPLTSLIISRKKWFFWYRYSLNRAFLKNILRSQISAHFRAPMALSISMLRGT